MIKLLTYKSLAALLFLFAFTSSIAQTACGTDTLNYVYYKTTTFRAIALNATSSANAFAQYYPVPQNQTITVSGFDFYAWQSQGNNSVVTLTCNLYRAGADSLPTGGPLRSITVNVDSTFGSGVITGLKKKAIFSTAANINFPYIITVENSTSTNVSILCNDYLASPANGDKEWLASGRIGANYYRSYAINVGGITFDADFLFQPYVSYTLDADFNIIGCNNVNNTVSFVNTSSSIINNPFYNRYAYYGITQFCYLWDYGDTSSLNYSINSSHKYNNRLDYTAVLKDTLYGWTTGCADTAHKIVYATPLPPKVYNTSPHCSGETIRLWVDTVPGTKYFWGGPKGFLYTKTDTSISNTDTSMNGVYFVNATANNCSSTPTNTTVTIHQTPAIPVVSNPGSKCVGDSAYFKATSASPGVNFTWNGPNGFSSLTDAFWFPKVDTTLRGDYIVYAENAFCKSANDTATLYIYPPPQPPTLATKTGATLCSGDSLFLVGNSVAGAVFDWKGPGGYVSSTTNPVIPKILAGNAGYYVAHVIIGSCNSTADSIEIKVNPLPVATVSTTSNTTFCAGDSAKINANTGPGLTYQWYDGGVAIPNSVAATMVAKTSGSFYVKVTNGFNCSDTSTAVGITAKPLPAITTHPVTKAVNSGLDVTFTVASPDAGAAYQWQENSGAGFAAINNAPPYSGVLTNTLLISPTTPIFNNRSYRCLISFGGCDAFSNTASLTINVGIKDVKGNEAIMVYPNPATDVLTVDLKTLKDAVSFTVADATGRVFIASSIENNGMQQINISQLAKGIYLLKIQAGQEEKITRFMVQ